MSTREITLAGETVVLHSDGALFWPRQGIAAIADLHLGKSQVFRNAGVPLPRGGTSHDLARLDRVVRETSPHTLLVLGDLLHGPLDRDAAWFARWHLWRESQPTLRVQAVLGNHDRAFDAELLHIENLGADHLRPPFRFAHLPRTDDDAHRIAGHLHPVVRLQDAGLNTRIPVFWLGATHSVLPAFTRFAGGYEIEPRAGDRLFACGEDMIASLPGAAFAR